MKRFLLALVFAMTALPALSDASPGGTIEPPHINWVEWHKGKDIEGGELEPGEKPMNPGMLFIIFNFVVFVLILKKYAMPAIKGHVATRHVEIKEALAEAGQLRDEARKKLEEYQRKIEGVDREIAGIVDDVKSTAEAERDRIIAQAEKQADAMRRDTKDRIEAAMGRARAEIEREVVAAAISKAEELLKQQTTPDDHAGLLGNFVSAMNNIGKEPRA